MIDTCPLLTFEERRNEKTIIIIHAENNNNNEMATNKYGYLDNVSWYMASRLFSYISYFWSANFISFIQFDEHYRLSFFSLFCFCFVHRDDWRIELNWFLLRWKIIYMIETDLNISKLELSNIDYQDFSIFFW